MSWLNFIYQWLFGKPKFFPMKEPMRILFITKRRQDYGMTITKVSGLYNSTQFIVRALNDMGIEAQLVDVVDNNSIDRVVSEYQPDIVIIEALWVVPEKFDILRDLHPGVKWFVHLHSNVPFLANESVAIDWLFRYLEKDVHLITNSPDAYDALHVIAGPDEIFHLPNVYLPREVSGDRPMSYGEIHIGCFGAIRPMKNHLTQALAAIRFAEQKRKNLLFYVNASRVEQGGGAVLSNLRSLFANSAHQLIESSWMDPDDFVQFLHRYIHIGMQCSLTETFNVVTADYVTARVPVVVSDQIDWVTEACQADPHSVEDIAEKLQSVFNSRAAVQQNLILLNRKSEKALKEWVRFIARAQRE